MPNAILLHYIGVHTKFMIGLYNAIVSQPSDHSHPMNRSSCGHPARRALTCERSRYMFVQRAALATLIALAVAPCANAQMLFFSPGEGGMPIIAAMNDLVPLIKRADVPRGIALDIRQENQ